MTKLRKKLIKGTAIVLASVAVLNAGIPVNVGYANAAYDYSNAIYSEGTEDTYVYEGNDKVMTTATGVKRIIPETSGKYDVSYYPIPQTNRVPSEEIFELIKAENKELMDSVETQIEEGTLKKHIAADGQFFGTIEDDVLGVEKTIYINTNSKGTHSLASYVPAGEIATVTLNKEALSYAKKGLIKITVGATMIDAEDYNENYGVNNRMSYLGKRFSVSEENTKVGTPFGGMVYLEVAESVPSGLQLEIQVTGVVDTPYYELGQTTVEEWETSRNAAGLFAEIRTPYLRFYLPSYFVREIEDPYQALLFWTNATALSATVMGQESRTTPITLIFDDYSTGDGSAYASIGLWMCNLPTTWATNALSYDYLMKAGSWGTIHEINHHFQTRYASYFDEWGVGEEYFGEITNNVLNTISYILYTNIAAYRGEEGLDDWNKVADPYSSLKQVVDNTNEAPNMGDFMYSTFAHEIGPVTLAEIIKSTYDGATFNGIEIPAYDYKAESQGQLELADRYDDFAYRICVASKRNYLWYLQEELHWPLLDETVEKITALGYEEVIPVQSVYAMGEVGRETGRPYYVSAGGYVFDFENSLVSPGKTTIVDISTPKYGTLTALEDGTYSYTPGADMPEGKTDEFTLTVLVEAGGISRETKLNCSIGVLYDSVNVEHYAITKWDVYEALETLKTSTPYKTTTSSDMRITADDGNNLAKATGYFSVPESGEYTFQAYGDDRAVFELQKEDGTTVQSLTVDYAPDVEEAYRQQGATHFTVELEANTPCAYTIISNNNGGIGWADVKFRSTKENSCWKSVDSVCGNLADFGKSTERSFKSPAPVYVRPSKVAASGASVLKDVSVISTPQGVIPNDDPNSSNEGDPNNIVDGDASTYFHSSYTESDKTPMPHDYIFDLGTEKSFNQIDVLYRTSGDDCGVIGDYEIYVADEYNGDATNWTLAAKDDTRKGNWNAPQDIKVALEAVSARYVMVRALNNRGDYDISIVAEVTFSMYSTVNKVIPQNSSYIQYKGTWSKDQNGAFVNGATYNTSNGSLMYCFTGKETNLYVTKDAEAEVRVDGGQWKKLSLTGSLREPSATLVMQTEGDHSVEVRGIGEELALNMISTDGTFYKGTVISVSNTLAIHGAENIELPVGKAASFNLLEGISYTDELGLTGLAIQVEGELGTPEPGTNADYKVVYSVTDAYENSASADRVVTVTNQVPVLHGLSDITIIKGESFDYSEGVTATDYEDGMIAEIELPELEVNSLSAGEHEVTYQVTDSDGNRTAAQRKISVVEQVVEEDKALEEDKPFEEDKPIEEEKLLEAVADLTASALSTSQVSLTWSKVKEADGYKVYRAPAATEDYALVRTITKNTTVSYKDSKLASGTTYQYKVVAYKDQLVSESAPITVTTKLSTPKVSVAATASTSTELKWSKVKEAAGYQVYRYNEVKKKYELVRTLSKASTVSYKDSKLASGTTYQYKVVAYKKAETSAASKVSATTKPGIVKISKIIATSKKTTIRWAKVAKASGYEVYRSTSKNGTYKKVATVKSAKTLTTTDSKVKAATTYYYKVRAYKVVDKTKLYGAYSKPEAVKVKK